MILSRLRTHTAELHQDVERHLDLLSPALTQERYIAVLRAFKAFFAPWEAAMDRACPVPLRSLWAGRQRAYRLSDDLRWLQADIESEATPEVTVPNLRDQGLWLGSLYVTEGSTLGGQVISRHLEKHFGWANGGGYSFFRGQGADTAAQWRRVCSVLEDSSEADNQILCGAHLTFLQLRDCLNLLL